MPPGRSSQPPPPHAPHVLGQQAKAPPAVALTYSAASRVVMPCVQSPSSAGVVFFALLAPASRASASVAFFSASRSARASAFAAALISFSALASALNCGLTPGTMHATLVESRHCSLAATSP